MSNCPVHDALWTGHNTAQPSMLPAAFVMLLHQPRAATIHRGPLASLSHASKWYLLTCGQLDASSLYSSPALHHSQNHWKNPVAHKTKHGILATALGHCTT